MKGTSEQASLRSGGAKAGGVFLARTKSFTRHSRELPASLQRTWDKYASHYVIEVKHGLGYTAAANSVYSDPERLFGRRSPLTVEIGSGTGGQITGAARTHPDRGCLAFEVWAPSIAKLISKAVRAGMEDIRVVETDAQLALPAVFDEAIAQEVQALFPDPWCRARHHKRRLAPAGFTPEVARVLKDGGLWHLAIGWDDYA